MDDILGVSQNYWNLSYVLILKKYNNFARIMYHFIGSANNGLVLQIRRKIRHCNQIVLMSYLIDVVSMMIKT